MGRPRKPTELLERDGTKRDDRHGGRQNQPKFDGAPAPPHQLSADAQSHWDRVVPELVSKRVAKAIDAPALAAMCEALAEYCTAKRIECYGDLREMRARQMLMSSSLKTWRDLAARFGLTPADRAKLEVAPDGEENPFKAFMQPANATPKTSKGKKK